MTSSNSAYKSKWKLTKLGELMLDRGYIRGPFGSSLLRSELKKEGIPVYEQQHVIDNHRKFRYFIDQEKYRQLKRFEIRSGDLLISCSGTIGKVITINDNDPVGIISQALLILRPDEAKIKSEYLKYYFSTKQGFNSLTSVSTGSVQINVAKREIVERINIPVPPIEIQIKIIEFIKNIDDLILSNQKLISNLEKTAQLLFKHWFIDFEFLDNNERPYKSSGGEMVEGKLGMIPKGWKSGVINDLCEKLASGGTPQTNISSYYGGDIYWLSTKELRDGYIFGSDKKITKDGLNNSSAKLFPKGSIVMAIYAAPTVGRLGKLGEEMSFNQAACGFVSKKDISTNGYLYELLFSLRDSFNNLANGAAQQNLSVGTVKNYPITIPNTSVLKKFDEIYLSIDVNILAKVKENIILSSIRELILPKLITGEVEI